MRPTFLSVAAFILGSLVQQASADEPVRFTAMDQTVVRVYFAAKPVVWRGLSPQQAKNFERGKPLPPGIVVSVLPRDLLARLPARRGFGYARIGADVALIDKHTGIVVDVIENVFG